MRSVAKPLLVMFGWAVCSLKPKICLVTKPIFFARAEKVPHLETKAFVGNILFCGLGNTTVSQDWCIDVSNLSF